jgi:hypothetical protein
MSSSVLSVEKSTNYTDEKAILVSSSEIGNYKKQPLKYCECR